MRNSNIRLKLQNVYPGQADYDSALSPAMSFIQIAIDHEQEASRIKRRSREERERNIRSAIYLAISMGLRFNIEDFEQNKLLGYSHVEGRRADNSAILGEGFYATACGECRCSIREPLKLSACRSLEKKFGRPPFIWLSSRIYVGRRFEWKGMTVECTSFAQDGKSIIVVSRQPENKKRIRINIDELRKAEKERLDPYNLHFDGTKIIPNKEFRWKRKQSIGGSERVSCVSIDPEKEIVTFKRLGSREEEQISFAEIRAAEEELTANLRKRK